MHRLAGGQEREQVVGKRIKLGKVHPVAAYEPVVGQHGRDGHRQAQPRHDQRFAHGAGNTVYRNAVGHANTDQRVIHVSHRTEQPHKGRGRADGRQHREAIFQLGRFLVNHLAHGTHHKGGG